MTHAFLQILDLSLTACPVILAILLLRLLLYKIPRKHSFLLWSIVALRLCLPLDMIFQSPFSLYNLGSVQTMTEQSQTLILDRIDPPVTGPTVVGSPVSPVPTPSAPQAVEPDVIITARYTLDPAQIAAMLWLVGMLFLLGRGMIAYLRLRRRMATATKLEGRVFESDQVRSPFILGFFRPRIYIPYGLTEEPLRFVLAHENEHIAQLDHLTRPYAWLLLCVHWFNPLVWLCYFLMGRDMEMRIDEAVLQRMPDRQADYSATLLDFAAPRAFPSPVSPCLGESAVGSRIRHILSWKKPALWLSILATLLCAAAIVVCLSNPTEEEVTLQKEPFPYAGFYFPGETVFRQEDGTIREPFEVAVTTNAMLYVALDGTDASIYSATAESPLLPLDVNAISDKSLIDQTVGTVENAWYCTNSSVHYYFLHAASGRNYLARGAKGTTQLIIELTLKNYHGLGNTKLYNHDIARTLGRSIAPLNVLSVGEYFEICVFANTANRPEEVTDLGYAVYDWRSGYVQQISCRYYPGAATGSRIYLADDPVSIDGIAYDVLLSWNNPDFVRAEWQKNGETVLTETFTDQLNTLTIHDRAITEDCTLVCYDAEGHAIDLEIGRTTPSIPDESCILTMPDGTQYSLPWHDVEPRIPYTAADTLGLMDHLPILPVTGDTLTFTIDPSWNTRVLSCTEDTRWKWSGAGSKGGSSNPANQNAVKKNGVFTYTIERGDSGLMESAICSIPYDGGGFWFEVRFLKPLQTLTDKTTAVTPYPHLANIFPEYTEVTGVAAEHDLERWANADPDQITAFLELLDRCASFEYEEIHFTEVTRRDQTGEYHFKIDLGAQTCELYTASVGGDALLFDFGGGNLRAYAINRMCESYKAWRIQDEKNSLSTQFHLLRDAICDGTDPTVRLYEPIGSETAIYPTKVAAEFARSGIRRALEENNLYTGDKEPNYNLEIIMDKTVYICDDELDVFHIKHKEDTVYQVPFPDCLNYDKTRPDWPVGRIVDLYQQ